MCIEVRAASFSEAWGEFFGIQRFQNHLPGVDSIKTRARAHMQLCDFTTFLRGLGSGSWHPQFVQSFLPYLASHGSPWYAWPWPWARASACALRPSQSSRRVRAFLARIRPVWLPAAQGGLVTSAAGSRSKSGFEALRGFVASGLLPAVPPKPVKLLWGSPSQIPRLQKLRTLDTKDTTRTDGGLPWPLPPEAQVCRGVRIIAGFTQASA